jgi:hypothetical protein
VMRTSVALIYGFGFSLAHALVADEKVGLNLPAIPPIDFAPTAKALPKAGFNPPRLFGFGLMWQCGGIQIPEVRSQPDPIPVICDAYRDVEYVEVWKLERAVDTFAYPRGFWGKYIYRDTAIARVARHKEYYAQLEAFQLVLDALSVGEDQYDWEMPYSESPTLEGSIESIEFDLFRHRALLTASGKWGFYNIDEFALQRLRGYEAKTTEALCESPEPTTAAITSAKEQLAR